VADTVIAFTGFGDQALVIDFLIAVFGRHVRTQQVPASGCAPFFFEFFEQFLDGCKRIFPGLSFVGLVIGFGQDKAGGGEVPAGVGPEPDSSGQGATQHFGCIWVDIQVLTKRCQKRLGAVKPLVAMEIDGVLDTIHDFCSFTAWNLDI
jgi:hypothetical protein